MLGSLITAVMALRHLDARLAPLEARLGLAGNGGQGQSSDIDARFAEAERKRVEMEKKAQKKKIKKRAALREAPEQQNEPLDPAEPADQPEDDGDRNKF